MITKTLHFSLFLLLLSLSPATKAGYEFSLVETPFSRYGSYLVFSQVGDTLFLREVSGKYAWVSDRIFKIEVTDNNNNHVKVSWKATPVKIQGTTDNGLVEICFDGTNSLRIKATNNTLCLTKQTVDPRNWEWIIPLSTNQYRVLGGFDKYVFTSLQGNLEKTYGERYIRKSNTEKYWAQFILHPDNNGKSELSIERYYAGWHQREYNTFEKCLQEVTAEYSNWETTMPAIPDEYNQAKEYANYIMWSSVVNPRGILTRPSVFMSKNMMRHIWSWDNCFNAMSLKYGQPELAWDQIMLFFDLQDPTGALLDYANDQNFQIDYVKPPVHGLFIKKLLDRPEMNNPAKLQEIYEPLEKWTNWWFSYSDDDHDGLPQCDHGNNGGADNATVFDMGYSVETPDLATYLILQMDVLSEIAGKLGKTSDASMWKSKADNLQKLLLQKLWNGKTFYSTRTGDDLTMPGNQTYIRFLPLLLGSRLPLEIRDIVINDLKTSGQITKFGIATENPKSKFYESDGYWRGPIWAPSTYLLIEGLEKCGEHEYAKSLAKKFCDMCKVSGFPENFDALTGKGLRDTGYTWTASVFLALAHEYLEPEAQYYQIYKAQNPLKIDGKINEPEWEKAEVWTLVDPKTGTISSDSLKHSEVRMLWDSLFIYAAFKFEDSDLIAVNTLRDSPVYHDDCAELFINPAPKLTNNYFGFEINLNQAMHDFIFLPEFLDGQNSIIEAYNPINLKTGVFLNGTKNDKAPAKGWELEMAIPIQELIMGNMSLDPLPGTIWKFNLARWDYNKDFNFMSSLRTGAKAPHTFRNFGKLKFMPVN
jgi:putative isomerase